MVIHNLLNKCHPQPKAQYAYRMQRIANIVPHKIVYKEIPPHLNINIKQKSIVITQGATSKSKDNDKVETKFNQNSYYKLSLVGLQNMGNACYLTTAIKCIAATYSFSRFFGYNKCTSSNQLYATFYNRFTKLMDDIFTESPIETALDIAPLKNALGDISPIYSGGSQNDCYQCIMTLLDKAHCSIKAKPIDNFPNFNVQIIEAKDIDEFSFSSESVVSNYIKENITKILSDSSFIYDMFLSINLLVHKCKLCKPTSYKIQMEIMNGIPLEIANHTNLQECIQQFYENQEVQEYYCSKCAQKVKMEMQRVPLFFPPILIFQLKRFIKLEGSNEYNKDYTAISYPLDKSLDMMAFLQKQVKDLYFDSTEHMNYSLIAVGAHIGILKCGHYFAYLYNKGRDCWEEHNDDKISIITPQMIQNKDAITLIYVREDAFKERESMECYRMEKIYSFLFDTK